VRSSSESPEAAEKVLKFFGGDASKRLTAEEAENVKRLAWSQMRADQRRIRKDATHCVGLSSMIDKRIKNVKGSQSPPEEMLALAMSTMPSLVGQFEPQYGIGPYFVDFGFRKGKLAVEVDGKGYHSSPADLKRDQHRANYITRLGWTLLRIPAREIVRNPILKAMDVARMREGGSK